MAGVFVSEGDIVVERAIRAGYDLRCLLVDGRRTKALPPVIDEDVPVYAAGPEVLKRITGYHLHRGMLACFTRREVASFEAAAADSITMVVMEGINNPTNLGVILRCAAGLGVDSFHLDPTSCDPLYRRCGRVSMGEAYAIPYSWLDPFPEGLEPLRQAGFELVALTPDPEAQPIDQLRYGPVDRVALLLGSEGDGLSDATLAACDRRVRIPMSGVVDSINVGSAAAVAFYAIDQARSTDRE